MIISRDIENLYDKIQHTLMLPQQQVNPQM